MATDTPELIQGDAGAVQATSTPELPAHPAKAPGEGRLIESLSFEGLGELLRTQGFQARPITPDDRTAYRCEGKAVFIAALRAESPARPGEYELVTLNLYMPLPPTVLAPVYLELQQSLQFVHAQIDDDGDLAVLVPVYVGGGVSEAHVARMFDYWRMTMEHVRQVINRHWMKNDPRSLN